MLSMYLERLQYLEYPEVPRVVPGISKHLPYPESLEGPCYQRCPCARGVSRTWSPGGPGRPGERRAWCAQSLVHSGPLTVLLDE